MKIRASLIIIITASCAFITLSKVGLSLSLRLSCFSSLETNLLYFAKVFLQVHGIHSLCYYITSFMQHNLCIGKPHMWNFSFIFNGNWFSDAEGYHVPLLLSHRKKNPGILTARKRKSFCCAVCVRVYESTRVSATVNKSHGQPERGTMVSQQTARASTTP